MTRWHGATIAYIDMLLALAVVLLALSILVQPAKKADADAQTNPGAMTVELWWDPAVDADVDLWTLAPGGSPVGYSNKTSLGMALLRDDLGRGGDRDSRNYELAVANVLRPGEYVINAMLYRTRDNKLPVAVTMAVTVRPPKGDPYILQTVKANLVFGGQEITLLRFTLDDKGGLIGPSINHLPKMLRSAKTW